MEAHYYQQTSVVRCGFCFDPLTQEKLKMYQDLKKVWTTVIPSCGDKQCLVLAPGKAFGFITKRETKKKNKNEIKQKHEAAKQKHEAAKKKLKARKKRKKEKGNGEKRLRKKRKIGSAD